MEIEATGTFEVALTPIEGDPSPISALAIAKRFDGDLRGDSVGQMLAFRSPVAGSAGYVAMERVTGTLGDRTGAFTLQHGGTMQAGTQSQSIGVVPDSGTDALTGLSGTMTILIADGIHSYRFRYALPD